jgi:hypothetical protein
VIDLRLQFAAKNWQPSGNATATGYGLYYAGSERLRAWTSWIHLGVGLIFPMGLVDSCRARKKGAAVYSGSETYHSPAKVAVYKMANFRLHFHRRCSIFQIRCAARPARFVYG